MSKVAEVAAYICKQYPHKSELSKTRLTKLVYLCDWEAALRKGRQLTNISWVFYKFGPYVDDVFDAISGDPRFRVVSTINYYGDPKVEIILKDPRGAHIALSEGERNIIDSVVDETKSMYWDAFIKHIYDTPPIAKSERYSTLDLVAFAHGGMAVNG